jgi:hypothetical protein
VSLLEQELLALSEHLYSYSDDAMAKGKRANVHSIIYKIISKKNKD